MKTVLIIDSDQDFCQTTSALLEPFQWNVSISSTSAEGIKETEQLHPDLIILSAELPDQSGYKVCKLLRAADHHSKIIICSARDDNKVFDRHSKLGYSADVYLSKPISQANMIKAISSLVKIPANVKGFDGSAAPEKAAAPAGDDASMREIIENQERELEYLRKEVAAFNSFMKQAQKTEADLKSAQKLLAQFEKQAPDSSDFVARIKELEEALEKSENERHSLSDQRRKLETDNNRLQEDLSTARSNLDYSENSLDEMKLKVKKAARISEDQSFDALNDQKHIETLQDQLQSLKARLEESKNLADERDSELMEARLELSALEEDKETLQANLNEEQDEARKLRTGVTVLEQKLETLEAENNKIRLEREQMERQLSEARDAVEDGEKRLSDQKSRAREKETDAEGILQTARNKVDELRDRLESLTLTNDRNESAAKDFRERLESRERELERTQQNKQRLEIDLEQTRQEINRLRENRQQDILELEKKLSEMAGKANASEEKQMTLEADLKNARKENQELHGKISAKEAESEGLRTDYERFRQELEAERDAHQRLIKRTREAESQFKSDTHLLETQKDELNSKIEALNTLLKQTKSEHDISLSVFNQEKAAQQEALTAEKNRLEQGLAAERARIHQLEDSIKSMEKKLVAEAESAASKLKEQKSAAEQALERAWAEAAEDKARQAEEFAKQKETFEKTIVNLEMDKRDLSAANSRQEERLVARDQELRKAQEQAGERIAELEHSREALNRSIQKEREGKEAAESRAAGLEDRLMEANKEHEKVMAELRKTSHEQTEALHHQILDYQSRIDQLENSLEKYQDLQARYDVAESENAALKLKSESLEGRLHRARKALEIVVIEMDGKAAGDAQSEDT